MRCPEVICKAIVGQLHTLGLAVTNKTLHILILVQALQVQRGALSRKAYSDTAEIRQLRKSAEPPRPYVGFLTQAPWSKTQTWKQARLAASSCHSLHSHRSRLDHEMPICKDQYTEQ